MKPATVRIIARSLFAVCLMLVATAYAQASEKPVKMKDLPEAVRKTVEEQSKGATLRGLTKEVEKGQIFYEAELRVNGHNKDLLIDSSGAIVEIEEVVALNALPAAVKAAILKSAGKGRIISVESITKNNAIEAYEAHVSRAGKRTEIKVGADGKLIAAEK